MTYKSGGTGQNDGHWEQVSVNDTKDYSVSGTLAVASGATNYLPPFNYQNAGTLVAILVKVRAGSCTLDINQNGSGVGGLTALAVSDSWTTYFPTDVTAVAVGDEFAVVLDSVDSADGLSCDFVFAVDL
jgi:hypothetical protein